MKRTIFKQLFILVCTLIIASCSSSYEVRNPRISPTYICDGDTSPLPIVNWEYDGSSAHIRLTSTGRYPDTPVPAYFTSEWDAEFCDSGARTGYCGPFSRMPNSQDLPIKIKIYKNQEHKKTFFANYEILTGSQTTESFFGEYLWSDEYQKCHEEEVFETNKEGTSSTIQTQEICHQYKKVEGITWSLNPLWFGDRVQVRNAAITLGNSQLTLSGPGLNNDVLLNIGQVTQGNNEHPGGTWFGKFDQPLETRIDASPYETSFNLVLGIACESI